MFKLPTDTFVLRTYPDDDALRHPEKYPKALSFCPDIVPAYGLNFDQTTLVDPNSMRGFAGLPIVGGDVNNIYIRGYGSGGPYIASLWVVPSELILWPHVWQNAKPVSSGPVAIQCGAVPGAYAADGPLHFRTNHSTGNAHSLVANVVKHDTNQVVVPQTFDLQNYGVDDFVRFLSKDKTFSFYNVMVADPTVKHIIATTRLRLIGKSLVSLKFHLKWHTGTPVPPGLEVSLVDDRNRIVVSRVRFKDFRDHDVTLESSYDGILMLNVFVPAGNPHIHPYSALSLQVFKNELFGDGPLLGALNIVFESQATRNIRFASPAASQLNSTDDDPNPPAGSGSIPVTNPATGWWTRAVASDTNKFPHTPYGYSPDIQAVGTDLRKQDFLTLMEKPDEDYSTANNIELVGNATNYVYMRGHSTLGGIDVQGRLFALSANPLNHPALMLTEGLQAEVLGSRPGETVNYQSISVENANKFYVFEQPFMFDHPPGDSNNHYCMIGEVRQKRHDCPVYPGWPTDDIQNYTTTADFIAWVLSNPLMCWRNINWEPCHPGDTPTWSWTCTTQLCIPEIAFECLFWCITVECDNKVIPDGSTWKLVCEDDKIFPNKTVFDTCLIKDPKAPATPPPCAGAHFTGAPPGYNAKLTLTVTWAGDGSNISPPSIRWSFAMTETLLSPIRNIAIDAPPGSDDWPLYVTPNYPFMGNEVTLAPLPSFTSAGRNTWPYKGAKQFHTGQVTVGGVVEKPA